jgi:16S rRNA (cytosine1402-N4)-methyltransferase
MTFETKQTVSDGENASPRPPRRKRYAGKNPRRFEDKYKEHSPELHPETIAKVIASGKTPAGFHIPIMVDECLTALCLQPGHIGVDCTLGHGGHATAILQKIIPGGKLIGLDLDPIELPKTEARLRSIGYPSEAFQPIHSNYAGIAKALQTSGESQVDFIFADLGCSSMQLDDPGRGFSFKTPGPLDMRMNPHRGLPASQWLARIKPEKLETVLSFNSDEPRADLLAPCLAGKNFPDTPSLANAIRQCLAPVTGDANEIEKTIRRVFQAIRIAINEEFIALDAFLRVFPACLKPGGRIAILTFHSGEDRRVKQCFKTLYRAGILSEISSDPIIATPQERHQNPRSTSAKLRFATLAPH